MIDVDIVLRLAKAWGGKLVSRGNAQQWRLVCVPVDGTSRRPIYVSAPTLADAIDHMGEVLRRVAPMADVLELSVERVRRRQS